MRILSIFKNLVVMIIMVSSQQGWAQTIYDIDFGPLYGESHTSNPTFVIDGSGPPDPNLIGHPLYWVCAEYELQDPENTVQTMYVSQDPAVLTGGIWGGMGTPERLSIASCTKNMFFNNQAMILADESGPIGGGPGLAYQGAIWYLTSSYAAGEWSGTIDSTILDEIIIWGNATFRWDPTIEVQIVDLLSTALTDAGGEIYFANSVNDPAVQPVMFFVIPEPGSMVFALFGVPFLVACSYRLKRKE